MFSISQDFAPPFKLISPFFILGSLFYLASVVFMFFISAENMSMLDTKIFGFVHLFLLGFVMMTIFGAMAQLVPVVLEVGHFAVELFYAIWPLLAIGTLMMTVGFVSYPMLLPFGGVVVLIAMMIFILEIFLTIKKVKKIQSGNEEHTCIKHISIFGRYFRTCHVYWIQRAYGGRYKFAS
jgi:hypothetical protein